MIGSNFSRRVSVSSGKVQMAGLDPGGQTLLEAEDPAESMVITSSLENLKSFADVRRLFHILLKSAQKMKTCQEKSLPQIHTQFLSKKIY